MRNLLAALVLLTMTACSTTNSSLQKDLALLDSTYLVAANGVVIYSKFPGHDPDVLDTMKSYENTAYEQLHDVTVKVASGAKVLTAVEEQALAQAVTLFSAYVTSRISETGAVQ